MDESKKGPVSIEDIYELIHSVNKNITTKIDEVKKDVQELSTKVDIQILEIKTKVQQLQSENIALKNCLKHTERHIKKNNLVIYGIEEYEKESQSGLIKTVQKLIIEKLLVNLESYDITNTFRLGRKFNPNTCRPVLVEFHSSITKKEILKNRTKLKGTNIFINEDLIEEDRKERKVLIEKLKEARKENRIATLKGNILIIDGKHLTYQDLKRNKPMYNLPYYTPPEAQPVLSEPCTLVSENHIFQNEEVTNAPITGETKKTKDNTASEPIQAENTKCRELTQDSNIKNNSTLPDSELDEKKRKLEHTPTKFTGTIPKKSAPNIEIRSSSRNRQPTSK